ncbi:MAG TPA: CHAT domain-containing protein [Terriglobales bacterium]|nr:CHAT domain-containing protein [Terriglobales bacterium]
MEPWDDQPEAPGGGCLTAGEWEEVAAGVRPPGEAEAWLLHAVGCAQCGPALRRAAAWAAEEESQLDPGELPSGQARGRRQLARRLRRLQLGGRAKRKRWPQGLGWALAVGVVLAGLVTAPRWGRAYVAAWLVQRAYSQHRLLPLRLAGAGYAPVLGARRGGAGPLPPSLLEAEGLVAAGLEAEPGNAGLLRLQAQAYLVAGDAAGAIADLRRALVARPRAPELLTDLASAYYESGADGHPRDYGQALDALGQALAARPRDPIARFNRALVEEALEDWSGAIADWTAYLGLDRSSGWAGEARQHLAQDQRKVARHDAAVAAPLLAPAALLTGDFDRVAEARIEDYLHAATVAWLPAAFPAGGAGDGASRAALAALAGWLRRAHHDAWLSRLLRQAPAPGTPAAARFAGGVAALAEAVRDNDRGRPDDALAAAVRAERSFGDGAPAGRARAAYEQVYALQRRELGDACLAVVQRWLAPAALAGEGWLQGQAALEQADCDGMVHADTAPPAVARALAVAAADHYPMLQLRAGFFLGADEGPDSEAFWRRERRQLALYWREPVGAYRGFSLYMAMAIYAGERRDWYAAERLTRAGVQRIALTPEISYQAVARQQLASFAEQCGFAAEAQAERGRADALFARLPATPTTANLRAYNQLALAEIAMQRHQPARARQALAAYRREQPPVVSLAARSLPYFSLLGQLQMEQGKNAAAALDERAAIAISESNLRGLAGDEDRLSWQARHRDAYRAWVRLQWRLHPDAVAALEFWEWARGASVRRARPLPASFLAAARRFDAAGAPPLPEPNLVRRSLPGLAHAQVVSYALLPHVLAIWIYDNRGIHGVRVGLGSARVEAAAHAFALACADPASDPALLRAEGQQLYGWLLAPVGAWLDPGRLLIVEADGDLAEVPFAALPAPGGGYLRQPVLDSPGLEYARLARPGLGRLARARLLAVGAPRLAAVGGVFYPPLPEARAEAEAAAARFAPGSRVLSGAAATRAAVLAALPAADAFHFAGHAASGALLLAGGGALTAADFTAARLPRCRLAVLAACATAAGRSAGLLDPQGLVRALLRAGVGRVVATRWAIDSATAGALDRAFYAALAAGEPVPQALAQAQRQLRRQPATAAPFYWAGFAAFGARPGSSRGGRAALPAGKIGAKSCEIPQGQARQWRVCAPRETNSARPQRSAAASWGHGAPTRREHKRDARRTGLALLQPGRAGALGPAPTN